MPVDHSLRIQENLVGHTTYIIGSLCVGVSISDNPLSAFLEVEQSLTNGIARCRCVAREDAGFDIDSFDVFVILGFFDGTNHVVQSQILAYLSCQHTQGIVLSTLIQLAG